MAAPTNPTPPRRAADDAQGWDNYEKERDAYITNTIMAQYNQICGKDAQGNPIDGAKVDPGMAIIFFIMVLGPVLASKRSDNIDKDSFKVQDLTDVSTAISELKKKFNDAKNLTNEQDQRDATDKFLKDLDNIDTKLANDDWLSELKKQYAQPLADLRDALKNGKTLTQVWSDAGFVKEFSPWGGIDYNTFDPNVPNCPCFISDDPDVPGAKFAEGTYPKEVWDKIKEEIGKGYKPGSREGDVCDYCDVVYDEATGVGYISINKERFNSLDYATQQRVLHNVNDFCQYNFLAISDNVTSTYQMCNSKAATAVVPEEVYEECKAHENDPGNYYTYSYDKSTNTMTIRVSFEKEYADHEGEYAYSAITGLSSGTVEDSINNLINKYNQDNAPGGALNPYNDNPDPTNQKKILSGLDTMASGATSLSNQFIAQQNAESGAFNEMINAIKDFAKELEKSMTDIIGKTR